MDPSLSLSGPQQAVEALALANQVRAKRADLRARWKADHGPDPFLEAAALVEQPPQWVAAMSTRKLLALLYRISPRRVRGMFQAAGIADYADPDLASLTPMKRASLVEQLRVLAERVSLERESAA